MILLAGGQEHPGQVQRRGGEEAAHSGGAGLRVRVRDHQQLTLQQLQLPAQPVQRQHASIQYQ